MHARTSPTALAFALVAFAAFAACKQGDPQPLEPLPAGEHCAIDASGGVGLVITSAQVGLTVNGTFQPYANGARVEVMPYSYESYLNVPHFVTAATLRATPPANVTETTLCGAVGTGSGSDEFNYVFHRQGAYLVAENVLVDVADSPGGLQDNLSSGVLFTLGNRTFRADTPVYLVTLVDEVGLPLFP